MESKEYFERVMQDYNQFGKGKSLSQYCKEEGIDYKWLMSYKRSYKPSRVKVTNEQPELLKLQVMEDVLDPQQRPVQTWQVSHLVLQSPDGTLLEIKCNNLQAVSELLRKMGA